MAAQCRLVAGRGWERRRRHRSKPARDSAQHPSAGPVGAGRRRIMIDSFGLPVAILSAGGVLFSAQPPQGSLGRSLPSGFPPLFRSFFPAHVKSLRTNAGMAPKVPDKGAPRAASGHLLSGRGLSSGSPTRPTAPIQLGATGEGRTLADGQPATPADCLAAHHHGRRRSFARRPWPDPGCGPAARRRRCFVLFWRRRVLLGGPFFGPFGGDSSRRHKSGARRTGGPTQELRRQQAGRPLSITITSRASSCGSERPLPSSPTSRLKSADSLDQLCKFLPAP
jgi:hypothetical protein